MNIAQANLIEMENFIKMQRDPSVAQDVQSGKICLGLKGDRLVLRTNCDSLSTKISNFFTGVKLINLNTVEENKNTISNFFKVLKNSESARTLAQNGDFCLGTKNGRLVFVSDANSLSTKIHNFFHGISTSAAKVDSLFNQTQGFLKLEATAKKQSPLDKQIALEDKFKADTKAKAAAQAVEDARYVNVAKRAFATFLSCLNDG